QELTTDMGMNLAGVERVFELEQELGRMRSRMEAVRRQAERAERELREEIERVRRSFRAELVPYEPPGSALIPARAARGNRVRIPISRPARGDGGSGPS